MTLEALFLGFISRTYPVTEFTVGRWPQDLMWSTVLLPHMLVTNTENQEADSPHVFSFSGAFQDPVASYMGRYQLTDA